MRFQLQMCLILQNIELGKLHNMKKLRGFFFECLRQCRCPIYLFFLSNCCHFRRFKAVKIVNAGSAFIEISSAVFLPAKPDPRSVGHAKAHDPSEFDVLLPTSSLRTMPECKAGTHRNRMRLFGLLLLSAAAQLLQFFLEIHLVDQVTLPASLRMLRPNIGSVSEWFVCGGARYSRQR